MRFRRKFHIYQISKGNTIFPTQTRTCDSSTIKLPYTDGTTDKTLEIKMSLNTPQEMKAQYGNWSFTLSADGKDYGKNNKLQAPLTNYGKDNNCKFMLKFGHTVAQNYRSF